MTNFNLLGSWVFRYSDNGGRSWSSSRFNLTGPDGGVYRLTDIDLSNSWNGTVREGWSVGKPLIADDGATVLMQFSKVSTFAGRSEGFFLRSQNVLNPATRAEEVSFELVPRGQFGFRATAGSIAEEGGVVQLPERGSFYAVYRTMAGFLNVATSIDGIDWRDAQYAYYDSADYGGGMYEHRLKQPRGPITPRRFSNGRFLLALHLNGFTPGWDMRDPYFLVGGIEQNGTIVWSQPEVALYILPPCAEKRCGIGYPDFVEVGSSRVDEATAWQIFITETDKVTSRVHALDMALLARLWNQSVARDVAEGKAAEWTRGGLLPIAAPLFGNLSAGASFSIEVGLEGDELHKLPLNAALLDCRNDHGTGIAILVGSSMGHVTMNISFCDVASHCQTWDTDAEADFQARGRWAHAVFIVDGRSRTIMTVSNGKWADGGAQRKQGYVHLGGGKAGDGGIGVVAGAKSCTVNKGAVQMLRIYSRALTVSEAIGNWRHRQHGISP